jgi:site-specific recombinase XerD
LHLRAKNRTDATIDAYLNDARHFTDWLSEKRRSAEIESATRADVEGFLADEFKHGLAAATVGRRYRSLLQLYRWMLREGEVDVSPMDGVSPPHQPEQDVPVIPDDHLRRLLAACSGARFEDRRDAAIIRLLASTGVRAGEIMDLRLEDVDLKRATFTVLGKGLKRRTIELLPKAAEALDRYIRLRRKHSDAFSSSALWLGARGPLSTSGLRQMLERRCLAAGLEPINARRFRHTFGHQARVRGMNDAELMSVAGWTSPQMLHRYGRSAVAERGRAAHRQAFEGGEP